MPPDLQKLIIERSDQLAPYKAGASEEQISRAYNIPVDKIIKIGSNENPYGTSERTREAITKAAASVHRYPDNHALLQALSSHTSRPVDNIVLGNGSTELIDMIARAFLPQGVEAVSSQHAFAMFAALTKTSGGTNVIAHANNTHGHDPDALLAAITDKTRVIWIANPNNPTGTYIPADELKAFLAKVPPHIIVVVDEAYKEYLRPEDKADTLVWLPDQPNLILLRTMSKIYGLAGLRVGYGLMHPQIAALLSQVKQPLNINSIALAASIAAIEDQDHVVLSYRRNREGLDQLNEGLDKLGLRYLPAYGNFITVQVVDGSAVNEHLLHHGIITRPLHNYHMPNHLRVTVGTPEENARFLETVATYP